jgi:hypothetical protein
MTVMADIFFIKPRPIDGAAAVIPDPHAQGRPLAADGEVKPRSAFWLRRLKDGDVTEIVPAPPEIASAPQKPAPRARARPAAPVEPPSNS